MTRAKTWFVTGTDTGIGKTTVSALLLHALQQKGLRTIGMKPVASGCHREDGLWINEDVVQLVGHSSVPVSRSVRGEGTGTTLYWSDVNPYAFEPPIAPHIAARLVGVDIRFAAIQSALQRLQVQADAVVIEGVGGFRVPLGPDGDTADLCRVLGVPVVLVVGMRLGCLNHALLTVEAIAARGLILAGWVANQVDAHMPFFSENLQTLQNTIPAPCLGVIPFSPGLPGSEDLLDVNGLLV